jgi:RNA polymerase sigma factor (sigma-70 family)
MKSAEDGFALLQQNERVVWGVLSKLGIRKLRVDYDDYLQDGRLAYVEYYLRYRDGVSTSQEQVKFNKLVFHYLYNVLRRKLLERSGDARAQCLENLVLVGKEPAHPNSLELELEVCAQLAQLAVQLTPRELEVLLLKCHGFESNHLIAMELGVTTSTVTAAYKRIRAKFSQNGGNQNDQGEATLYAAKLQ